MTRKYFEKYKSCQCEGKFITKIKTGRRINVDASGNTNNASKKYYVCNPATCSCKNDEYFVSSINDSVIMCD